MIGAGSMGLDEDGRVVAFGDFDGNQLYVLSSDICSVVWKNLLLNRAFA